MAVQQGQPWGRIPSKTDAELTLWGGRGPGVHTSLMSSLPSLMFSVAPTTSWWMLSMSASCGRKEGSEHTPPLPAPCTTQMAATADRGLRV